MCALLIGSLMSALERCSRLGQTKQCWSYIGQINAGPTTYMGQTKLLVLHGPDRAMLVLHMGQTTCQLLRSIRFEHDSTFSLDLLNRDLTLKVLISYFILHH